MAGSEGANRGPPISCVYEVETVWQPVVSHSIAKVDRISEIFIVLFMLCLGFFAAPKGRRFGFTESRLHLSHVTV